jgi:hypothetical protein
MVEEIPPHYRPQLLQRSPDFLVHPLPQLRMNVLQLGCHTFADRLPVYREIARLVLSCVTLAFTTPRRFIPTLSNLKGRSTGAFG